ncbi:52 kDa repressor of the inhibitor of the protein kinase-like [Apostichopus japonicus]|uniref:52 kDa repressor of the inhibitor of the protein kinase-like n=1 Tax=Stichopus japonicus TaxID=307972 RepID=UPI003AB68FE0
MADPTDNMEPSQHDSNTADEDREDPDVGVRSSMYDVSQCVGKRINDDSKYKLIKDRIPPASYIFPCKEYPDKAKKSGVRKRSCQHKWFTQFEYITYSLKESGLYCLACVLFPVENRTSCRAQFLINKSYTNWKDALADLKKHSVCEYHKTSAALMESFVRTTQNEASRVDLMLNARKMEQIAKNRDVLRSILRCVEYCGRHGIAMRGHAGEDAFGYSGNFNGLLRLCIESGDKTLEAHFETCARSATYSSKTTQNELLNCIKEFIQQHIIKEINAQHHGPLFGIQADEVTDVSNKEQLGLVLRYLVNDKPVERIVEFIECENITGLALAKQILDKIDGIGLSMNECRSQSYDGAGNMAGLRRGCASRISNLHPKAVYYYCMSHDLNLAVSKSCNLPEMQVMLDAVKQVGLFFRYSPKKQTCLEASIDKINRERRESSAVPDQGAGLINKRKVKMLCETRWVERHTALQDLDDMFEAVIDCLASISSGDGNWDTKSVTEANGLLIHLTSPKLIVAFKVNLHFSGYLKSLSLLLQGPTQDIITAHEKVKLVLDEFKDVRATSEDKFREVWQNAQTLAGKEYVQVELSMPRRCGQQTMRSNIEANSPEDYWRKAIFITYLDHLISEFNSRFTHASKVATRSLSLLPAHIHNLNDEEMSDIHQFYAADMPSPNTFTHEINLWKREWRSTIEDRPKDIEETLNRMNKSFYPNITQILRLLLMLPVSSASVERSHSALKLIKNKLRSTMENERLNALVLLYVHKSIKLDYDIIIDMYARRNTRRMMLCNPLAD